MMAILLMEMDAHLHVLFKVVMFVQDSHQVVLYVLEPVIPQLIRQVVFLVPIMIVLHV